MSFFEHVKDIPVSHILVNAQLATGGQVGDPWRGCQIHQWFMMSPRIHENLSAGTSIKGLTFLWTLNNKETLRKEREPTNILLRIHRVW